MWVNDAEFMNVYVNELLVSCEHIYLPSRLL